MSDFDVDDDFQHYKYYNGESENPFCGKSENPLDFSNPKALFWNYEKHYDESEQPKDYNTFISNLINNKLSEYYRNEKELWEMYHHHSIKK